MNIIDYIGNTPLLYLDEISKEAGANIYLKAELYNPSGSVKDRVAYAYIYEAMKYGKLAKGGIVMEATSGNVGIALAHICAKLGMQLKIVMPASASVERRQIMAGLGAELVLSPAEKGMSGAIAMLNELKEEFPQAFCPSQFSNPDGPMAHYEHTGPEIHKQAEEQGFNLDVFLTGVGTGATFSGVGRYLKEKNENIFIAAVEPQESAVLSGNSPAPHGIQGIGAGFIPEAMNVSLADEIIKVNVEEALTQAKKLRKVEGINAGISTGANLSAALKLASRPEFKGKNIVTVACDTGERYLSTALFQD